MTPVLQLVGITKRFGSLVANDNISLSLARGEVLALLGENGAGKTTLMNILFGHYVADEGHIEIDGQPLPPGSPDAAIAAGIGMVHQHFTLAENLTALDNVMLGTERLWSLRQNKSAARKRLRRMATEFGLVVDPDRMVGELSVGERQRVEILKALYRDARILILDEPTAVLTPQEIDSLFDTLHRLVDRGLSIVFISHKLHEILRISAHVMVLRRGKSVGTVATADADRDSLAELMVGHAVNRPKAEPLAPGKPVLELRDVGVRGKGNRPLLDHVGLTVREHEIVGVAGVAGNGQGPLADLVNGLLLPDTGEVRYFGQHVARATPDKVVHLGVGRIPEDRHAAGIVGEMAVWENLISENLHYPPVSRGIFLDRTTCRRRAEKLIHDFDIRCEGPDAETRLLSGGNIQKLILARALSPEPGLIVANQPVRGLDEGAIAYVHEQLLQARRRGAGILLITEDLDELLALADQVAVIYHGAISPPMPAKSVTARQLGLMMSGHRADENRGAA